MKKNITSVVLICFLSLSVTMGCTSKDTMEEKYYLTGTVYIEGFGLNEYNCNYKLIQCFEEYTDDGKMFLDCNTNTVNGRLSIGQEGGVKDYNLEKEQCYPPKPDT